MIEAIGSVHNRHASFVKLFAKSGREKAQTPSSAIA
jgi:hypothetical protein